MKKSTKEERKIIEEGYEILKRLTFEYKLNDSGVSKNCDTCPCKEFYKEMIGGN